MKGAPPVIWLIIAFGAGLATGLLHFIAPVPGMFALAVLVALGRRGILFLVGCSSGLGWLLGLAALWESSRHCAAALPDGKIDITIRLVEEIVNGTARAAAETPSCRGWITTRFDERTPPPPVGAKLEVAARWISRPSRGRPPDGTLVVNSFRVVGMAPTLSDRLRAGIAAGTRRLYGPRAPIADALVLGRRTAMDPALREDFARSGLVHLLAISGFHVGIMVTWTILLARVIGIGRPRAAMAGAAAALSYAAFLGWPPPATRAALLALLLAWGINRQRSVRAEAQLAFAALLVLLGDPWAVFDLGAWLSVGSIAGIIVATRWSDRALGSHWGWRMLAASAGSTLFTAPITALVLGTVAPAGLLLNFLAIPLASLAVPGVAVSLVIAPVLPSFAESIASGSGLVLAALEGVSRLGSKIPGGHFITEPSLLAAAPWIGLLALTLWGIRGGARIEVALTRWALAAALVSWGAIPASVSMLSGDADNTLSLHFLDVGQGDAVAIHTPGGRWVLIDAGPVDRRFNAGRQVVAPYLARKGARSIDLAIMSHAHADHIGGLAEVARRVPVGLIVEPGMPTPDQNYREFLEWVESSGQNWRIARRGARFELDGVTLEVLHPDTVWSWWGLDLNENSLVIKVSWGWFTALLTGDAGLPAESYLAGRLGRVFLLKTGHHGSKNSTGSVLLSELRPRLAVISAGRNNRHGHPAPVTLERLDSSRVAVLRTDTDGTVSVSVTDKTVRVRGSRRKLNLNLQP